MDITSNSEYLQNLLWSEPLRKPVLQTALRSLTLPEGSTGVDVGCGLGMGTRMLADIVGSTGKVIGLDYSPLFIEHARRYINHTAHEVNISYQLGDARQLPWDENVFDWACSIDFIGYSDLDIHLLLRELVRVVKPGGIIAIIAWSSQLLLPGYPLLEARLNATPAGIAPFKSHMQPAQHFLRGRRSLIQIGFPWAESQTFVGNINAPLSQEVYNAVSSLIRMRWEDSKQEVDHEVWEEYQRVCSPESPDFILNIPEYHGFFTYTMIYARVP